MDNSRLVLLIRLLSFLNGGLHIRQLLDEEFIDVFVMDQLNKSQQRIGRLFQDWYILFNGCICLHALLDLSPQGFGLRLAVHWSIVGT